ncbi:MAG: hypothetical protein V1653_01735 [bacterium]
MVPYIIILVLLGILIALDGIKAYHVYHTSTVGNKKLLLVVHYVLLVILGYLVVLAALDMFRYGLITITI